MGCAVINALLHVRKQTNRPAQENASSVSFLRLRALMTCVTPRAAHSATAADRAYQTAVTDDVALFIDDTVDDPAVALALTHSPVAVAMLSPAHAAMPPARAALAPAVAASSSSHATPSRPLDAAIEGVARGDADGALPLVPLAFQTPPTRIFGSGACSGPELASGSGGVPPMIPVAGGFSSLSLAAAAAASSAAPFARPPLTALSETNSCSLLDRASMRRFAADKTNASTTPQRVPPPGSASAAFGRAWSKPTTPQKALAAGALGAGIGGGNGGGGSGGYASLLAALVEHRLASGNGTPFRGMRASAAALSPDTTAPPPLADSASPPADEAGAVAALERENERLVAMYEYQRKLALDAEAQRGEAEEKLQAKIVEAIGLASRLEESKRFIRQLKKESAESRARTVAMLNGSSGSGGGGAGGTARPAPVDEAQLERLFEQRVGAAVRNVEMRYAAVVRDQQDRIQALEELLGSEECSVTKLAEAAMVRNRRLLDEVAGSKAAVAAAQERAVAIAREAEARLQQSASAADEVREQLRISQRALASEREYVDELLSAIELMRNEVDALKEEATTNTAPEEEAPARP
jgi:hypothetical protein